MGTLVKELYRSINDYYKTHKLYRSIDLNCINSVTRELNFFVSFPEKRCLYDEAAKYVIQEMAEFVDLKNSLESFLKNSPDEVLADRIVSFADRCNEKKIDLHHIYSQITRARFIESIIERLKLRLEFLKGN